MRKFLTSSSITFLLFIIPIFAKSQLNSSVLSTGDWFKVKVNESGLYKISYEYLQSMSFPVANLKTSELKVYGNATGMLPLANAIYRPDDLLQNALIIEDGGDGNFNPGDYVLFFGKSPDNWSYNELTDRYEHIKHAYDDFNYYFITRNTLAQNVVSPYNQAVDETNLTAINTFVDYKYHERDLENLIKSGRVMYGEKFDFTSAYSFNFNFPNLVPGAEVKLFFDGATACKTSGNNFQFTANGNQIGQLNINNTIGQYLPANTTSALYKFLGNQDDIQFGIRFNRSNLENKAWLNYLSVNVTRRLTLSGNSLLFRSPSDPNVVAGNFSISASNPQLIVLDVSNPVNPTTIPVSFFGGNTNFKANTSLSKEFYAFSGSNFPSPSLVGKIQNQNLHALNDVDMIILSFPDFVEQADRIATIHRNEGLRVEVVLPAQVYNEFSSGAVDPTAIKDLMKMLYKKAGMDEEAKPKYLLLFGDGSYNPRDFSGNTNLLPTMQSQNSTNETSSYVNDDYFGFLDEHESDSPADKVDIGIGRFPVRNLSEAKALVDKIERYLSKGYEPQDVSPFGDWRNKIVFVSDDTSGEPGNNFETIHQQQSNNLAVQVENTYPSYRLEKIYADAYKQLSTPGGQRYPDVNLSLKNAVQRGALMVNYTGHGGEVGWAHERILDVPTINGWTNQYAMPLFFTATCEFSRFDDPDRVSAGEYVLLNPKGGGIALLTTTRLVFSSPNFSLNRDFFRFALPDSTGKSATLGELYKIIKNNASGNGDNHMNFTLLGDPALRLAYPRHKVLTTHVNNKLVSEQLDTLKAFSNVKIKGQVADYQNSKLGNYNGILTVAVYDKADTAKTLNNDAPENTPMRFTQRTKLIYKGNVSVVNGDFEFEFIVPKDILLSVGKGYINYYAQNGNEDAGGSFSEVLVGGVNDAGLSDDKGPTIELYINKDNFKAGDITDENPSLLAYVADESGINTTGNGIGHDIVAVLDANTDKAVVLNEYYQANLDSYKEGVIRYPYAELAEGEHTLSVRVWDINNNSSMATTTFVVINANSLSASNFYNFPNPLVSTTNFSFDHNQAGQDLFVKIDIFNSIGVKVKTIEQTIEDAGYKVDNISWDGTTDSGHNIERGVYVYRLTLKNSVGKELTQTNRLMVLK